MRNNYSASIVSMFIILLLTSCIENDKTLGEQFVSDDYILKVQTEQFNVPFKNSILDSIQGIARRMIVGDLTDQTFGTTQVNCASIVIPLSDSTYFGIEPRLKDVYLSLQIDTTIFFEKDQEGIPQNLYIYKMVSDLDSTMGFNNSITTKDYDPKPISTGSPVIFGKGTIKINLTKEFGNELLKTTAEEFGNSDLFIKRIKGLFLTSDAPSQFKEGGRLNYIPLSKSFIYLDYVLNDPTRGFVDHDTTEAFAFGYIFSLNNFNCGSKHLVNDKPTDKLYMEGFGGVKPHIEAKELKAILDEWVERKGYNNQRVLISRASLEMPYEMPSNYERFDAEHPGFIYPSQNDPTAKDTLRFFHPLDEVYNISSPGAINRSLQSYIIDITQFTQSLIMKNKDSVGVKDDLWISPIYLYQDSNNKNYYSFDINNYSRLVLNGPTANRKPTLKISYTILNH